MDPYNENYYTERELRELLGDEAFENLRLPHGPKSYTGRQVLQALDALRSRGCSKDQDELLAG